MTRRSWILALLGVAVLALSWVALRDRRGVPDGVSEGSIDALVDGPSANAAADASTPSRTLERLDVSAHTAHGAPPRPPAYAQPPVDILVVDAETDAPVEGAEVAFDDGSADARVAAMPVGERGRLAYDAELVARTFGGTTRTGADGVARVRLGTNGGTVHARADGRYGMLHIDAAAEGPPCRHRLVIERDHGFTVRVVDATGAPAVGVPIAIGAIGEDGTLVDPRRAPTTSTDGTVTLLHIQRNYLADDDGVPSVGTKCVFVALPGLADVRATFEASSPPTGIVVLQLPPTGSIAVRRSSDGQTEDFNLLSLRLAADVDRENDTVAEWVEPGVDGWTRFLRVPLGQTFAIVTSAHCPASPTFAGPTRAGELVRFEWGPRDGEIWLRGRLVDARGAPVTTEVSVVYVIGVFGGVAPLTPDSEGRFVCCLGSRPEGSAEMRRLEFSRRPPAEAPDVVLVAKRSLDATVTDLGELRLVPTPAVVAGRFVFAAGVQPWNIEFVVERHDPDAAPDAPAEGWSPIDLSTDQAPDGRFAVWGTTDPGRHRLRFSGTYHVPIEPIEFLVGTRGLEIPIDVGASLTASLLLPETLDNDGEGLHAVLRRASGPFVQSPRDFASMKRTDPGRGVLHWTNLRPDVHTLEIRLHGFATPIVTVTDVNVPPPDDGDPRLRDIDLRERVELLRVRVPAEEPLPWENLSGPEGELPTGPIVFLLPQDSDREWRGSTYSDDRVDLVIPRGGVDVVIAKVGRQPVTLRGAHGNVELALPRWPEVEVVVEGLDAVPSPFVVVAQSERLSATSGRKWTAEESGGDLDELLLAPAFRLAGVANGRMRLPFGERSRRWSLWLHDVERDASARIACATPTLAPSAQPLVVRVPPDALARAIAELRAEAPVEKDR